MNNEILTMLPIHHVPSNQLLQSLETVFTSVNMPDNARQRLSTFEDIIIDAFMQVVISKRTPALAMYFDMVLSRYPNLRFQIKNQLGNLGIKALAGVPVVMLREFDSETVKASLPGIVPMLLHHLLEVVSDKIEADSLAKLFNIPETFAADFAVYAYDLLGGQSINGIQSMVIEYLQSLDIRELNLSHLDNQYGALFSGDNIRYMFDKLKNGNSSDMANEIGYIADNPIKYLLLFNLVVIDYARYNLDHALIWVKDTYLIDTGQVVLYDFAMQSLCARYFSCAVTQDPGYASMDLKHAIETRSDSILTNYTMSSMISAVAATNTQIFEAVESEQAEIEEVIRLASQLIGMANDCGFRILRMNRFDIRQEISKLQQLESYPTREGNNNHIIYLHEQAKKGMLEQTYLALFPLIKDISKGERNLVLDCRFDANLDGWERVLDNLVLISRRFQHVEAQFHKQLDSLKCQKIARLIQNFVLYNYQIYDLGADYDHRIPVIENLQIMQ